MDTELIERNWNKFDSLCRRFDDSGVNSLLEALGERLAVCPHSIKTEYGGCYPGGLIDVTLRVTACMRKINDTLEEGVKVSTPSLLKVGLLHDIGRVGDQTTDHFLEQDSSWHREKLGQLYKYNEEMSKMTYPHRSLYLLQHFGVSLERDEWEAILLSGGMHLEENRFYSGTRSQLSRVLLSARMMTL